MEELINLQIQKSILHSEMNKIQQEKSFIEDEIHFLKNRLLMFESVYSQKQNKAQELAEKIDEIQYKNNN